MTGDKLMQGISAVKTINDINVTLAEKESNRAYCKRIEGCLSTITDVLQEAVNDMVHMDEIERKIKNMNETLEKHLNKISTKR